MSVFVNKTPAIFVNGNLWQSQTNKITLDIECDLLECTNWKSSGSREYTPGLVTGKLSVEGFVNDTIGSEFFNNSNNSTGVVTIISNNFNSATQTQYLDQSYSLLVNETKYQVGGAVGEAETFTIEATADYPLARNFAQCLHISLTTGYNAMYGWNYLDYGSTGGQLMITCHHFVVQNTSSFQSNFYCSCSSGIIGATSLGSKSSTGITSYRTVATYGAGTWTTDRPWVYFNRFSSGTGCKALVTMGVVL